MDLFFLTALLSGKLQTTAKFEASMEKLQKDALKYSELKNSPKLTEFDQLEALVTSKDFADKKNTFGKKFEQTEEGKQEQRYLALKKDPDIVFLKSINKQELEAYLQYEVVYNENFQWSSLKDSDWKPGTIYPSKDFKAVHSYTNEQQGYNNGNNVSTEGGFLHIMTVKEPMTGAAWDEKKGMVMKNFPYSSDMICNEKIAIHEGDIVQIKLRCRGHLNHGFYLRSPKHLPFINVIDYNGLKIHVGYKENIKDDSHFETINGVHPLNYRIYTLSWQKDELVWYCNNVELYRTTNMLKSDEKLYMTLYSFIMEQVNTRYATGGELQVEWVRVIKKKQ